MPHVTNGQGKHGILFIRARIFKRKFKYPCSLYREQHDYRIIIAIFYSLGRETLETDPKTR